MNSTFILDNDPLSHNVKKLSDILILLICISTISIGVPGNIWVLLKIAFEKQLRNIRFLLVSSQSVVDLTICFFLAGSRILAVFYTNNSKIRCQIIMGLYGVAEVVSPIVLTLIAVERYIITMLPLHRPTYLTRRNKIFALLFLWAVSTIVTIAIWLGSGHVKDPESSNEYHCSIDLWGLHPSLSAFLLVLLFYIIPALTQVVLYSTMTKKSFQDMKSTLLQTNGPSQNRVVCKMSLMFLLASLNFIILRFLNAMNALVYIYEEAVLDVTPNPYDKSAFFYLAWSAAIPLVYLCSAITPWIYVFMSPIMKQPFVICRSQIKQSKFHSPPTIAGQTRTEQTAI